LLVRSRYLDGHIENIDYKTLVSEEHIFRRLQESGLYIAHVSPTTSSKYSFKELLEDSNSSLNRQLFEQLNAA